MNIDLITKIHDATTATMTKQRRYVYRSYALNEGVQKRNRKPSLVALHRDMTPQCEKPKVIVLWNCVVHWTYPKLMRHEVSSGGHHGSPFVDNSCTPKHGAQRTQQNQSVTASVFMFARLKHGKQQKQKHMSTIPASSPPRSCAFGPTQKRLKMYMSFFFFARITCS